MSDAINNYHPFEDVFDFVIYTFLPFIAAWNYSLFKERRATRVRTFFNLIETNLVKYSIPFICCLVNKDISFYHPMTYTFLTLMGLDFLMLVYWVLMNLIVPDLSIFNMDRILNNRLHRWFHLLYLFIQVVIRK